MIESCKLPFRFDASGLKEDLDRIPETEWSPHYSRDYSGSWSVVSLRSLAGLPHDVHAGGLPAEQYRDTELLARSPGFREVVSTLRCPKANVRLMRLSAGSRILEHADSSVGYENGCARLHVPVRTHPAVEFRLDNRLVEMREGECWYLNLNLPHRVDNAGPCERVHLVLDCFIDDWLAGVFHSLGFGEAEARGITAPEQVLSRDEARHVIAQLRRMNTSTSRRLVRELAEAHDLEQEPD